MSLQYLEYLNDHIRNVENGLHWMDDNLIKQEINVTDIDFSIALNNAPQHDYSKYKESEYEPYDTYFYGGNRSYAVKTAFDRAWLHHQNSNPHHWQYWVLINDDDGKNRPLEMPVPFVLEMIADWWSFSWRSGNLKEVFDWYESHKNKMLLHEKTRKLVEDILKAIKEKLKEQEEPDDRSKS